MNELSYKTALVFIPPSKLWEPIQNIRKEYDENFRRWMPHITLIYPFLPVEKFPSIYEKLSVICQKQKPFSIHFDKFGFFSQRKRNVVWFAPSLRKPFIDLQHLLVESMPQLSQKKKEFCPHMTMAHISQKEKTEEMIEKFTQELPPFSCTFDKISLIHRNDPPDDIFRIEKEIHFGQTTAAEKA